jgi:hypothetical protein
MIKFIKENDIYFALLQNEAYKDMMCEEVMFAELEKTSKGWVCRWSDKYDEKHPFQELGDAQQYVVLEWTRHKGIINGKTWEIEE